MTHTLSLMIKQTTQNVSIHLNVRRRTSLAQLMAQLMLHGISDLEGPLN